MSGGPSQTDTFDMKPGHANGGEFKELATSIPGFQFSEHLPKLAEHADQLAIVRSLSTKEGDHARGTHLVRTGHPPMGDVAYPSIACSLAKELAGAKPSAELCERRAAARDQPGRVRARLSRPELRAGHRRRQRGRRYWPGGRSDAQRLRRSEARRSRAAGGRRCQTGGTPAGTVERAGAQVPRQPTAPTPSRRTTPCIARPPR